VIEARGSIGVWRHVTSIGPRDCQASRDGLVIMAMVAAGNESVPRNA
jgi:hypothetical protein